MSPKFFIFGPKVAPKMFVENRGRNPLIGAATRLSGPRPANRGRDPLIAVATRKYHDNNFGVVFKILPLQSHFNITVLILELQSQLQRCTPNFGINVPIRHCGRNSWIVKTFFLTLRPQILTVIHLLSIPSPYKLRRVTDHEIYHWSMIIIHENTLAHDFEFAPWYFHSFLVPFWPVKWTDMFARVALHNFIGFSPRSWVLI